MKVLIGTVVGLLWVAGVSAQLRMPAAASDTLARIHTIKPPADKAKFIQPIPQDYYAQHLGFFCRQELKMQRAKVPVTFRVGSMEQCNRLEQKPGYR